MEMSGGDGDERRRWGAEAMERRGEPRRHDEGVHVRCCSFSFPTEMGPLAGGSQSSGAPARALTLR